MKQIRNTLTKAEIATMPKVLFEGRIFVIFTEDDYEYVRCAVAHVLGPQDDYLEVFHPDMAYSDMPIKKCIFEDLADIYQDLKDFISVFQLGMNVTMNDSLCVCKEHFAEFWGQRLVNTMRALHDVKYNASADEEELDEPASWDNEDFE